MNRHFVNYFPDEGLGTPIRREESKSRETPWVPTDTPGYVRRINAEGMPEVSHVDNLPKPEPLLVKLDGDIRLFGTATECAAKAPEAATLGAESQVSTPDAALLAGWHVIATSEGWGPCVARLIPEVGWTVHITEEEAADSDRFTRYSKLVVGIEWGVKDEPLPAWAVAAITRLAEAL